MDVGDPSNFPRVRELFRQDHAKLSNALTAVTVDDDETVLTIKKAFAENNYVLDPHGAVAYRALADYLSHEPELRGIFLETAHPVKFESVGEILGNYAVAPELDVEQSERTRRTEIDPEYEQLREILRSMI
jgi:threonine synthase